MNYISKYLVIFVFFCQIDNIFANSDVADRIKSYLVNIKSIAVEFEQTDSNDNRASGMLIIDKPFKFRCNYYTPFPLLIIGNKNYVSVYDYEMEHLSRIKAEENIFYFLLVDQINFQNKFEIISAVDIDNTYQVELYHPELSRTSQITFDKATGHIKLMQIFENNNTISIKFLDTKNIKDVNTTLFNIQDPDIFGKPKRLDKKTLEKMYKLAS
jgi:outer membrane lipoprotein-sorting protein